MIKNLLDYCNWCHFNTHPKPTKFETVEAYQNYKGDFEYQKTVKEYLAGVESFKPLDYYEIIGKQVCHCKNDEQRLQVLKEFPKDIMVRLDNDVSWIQFHGSCYENLNGHEQDFLYDLIAESSTFRYYHGNRDGVVDLFKFAGITAGFC